MTDTIPFAATQDGDEGATPDRKKQLIALGAAGAVVLAAGGYFLLGRGGSEPTYVPIVKGHVNAAAAPGSKVAKPKAAKAPTAVSLPPASTSQLGRDPFKVLYVAPVVAPPAAVRPSASPGTATTTNGTSTTPATTPVATDTTYPVKLTKVSGSGAETTATFLISGHSQIAQQQTVFGKFGELQIVGFTQESTGYVVTLKAGESAPFDIAVNQTLSVR